MAHEIVPTQEEVEDQSGDTADSERTGSTDAGLSAILKAGLQGAYSLGERLDPRVLTSVADSISQDFTERKQLAIDREKALAEVRLKEMELRLQAAKQERDDAVRKAESGAKSRLASTTEALRGVVLLLVVLTLVATPLFVMFRTVVTPESFAQYMAPVTGIAGTVIGYWFGKQENSK